MDNVFLCACFFFFRCLNSEQKTYTVPMGYSLKGSSGCFLRGSQLRQSRATQPTVHGGWFSVSMIHRTVIWTVYRISNECTDAHGHLKRVHWKLTLAEKSLAVPGNRTCVSGAVPVRCSTNGATFQPTVPPFCHRVCRYLQSFWSCTPDHFILRLNLCVCAKKTNKQKTASPAHCYKINL